MYTEALAHTGGDRAWPKSELAPTFVQLTAEHSCDHRRSMRRAIPLLLAFLPLSLALITGCPAEAPPPRLPPAPTPPPAAAAQATTPRRGYSLGDPDALPRGTTIALEKDTFGAVIEGARVLVRGRGGEDIHLAKGTTANAILGVDRVPAWLGGGFLFRTLNAIYTSDTFDGALRPVAALEDGVNRVSFGPKGVLVGIDDGHRHLLDLASGAALPINPPGLVDVLTLADGRAAALLEGGRLALSKDRGERWDEVAVNPGGVAVALASRPGEIWIETPGGRALRVEPNGGLLERDKLPSAAPEPLRAPDPAWRSTPAPLVAAVRRGVKLDDDTAIVAAAGDVVRIGLRTGAVKSVSRGRLPPDLPCEALRHGSEVLAVCGTFGYRRPSIVVSRLLEENPSIERTFPVDGPFYVGDDGSLAFGGSCDGTRTQLGVCVREAPGVWRDRGVKPAPKPSADAGVDAGPRPPAGADAGAPDPRAIVRWVLGDGGHPVALLGGKNPGSLDPDTGAFRAWKKSENEGTFPDDILRGLGLERVSNGRVERSLLDRRWSMRDGVLRGWLDTGQFVKIRASGDVERSAFVFPRASMAGAFGFAIDAQDRTLQSIDHGETWVEVAPPPVLVRENRSALPPRCSALGCEIGPWLRLGWDDAPPPVAAAPPPPVALPLRAPRAPLPEIACVSAGNERLTVLPTTINSPSDFGLGARRLPTSKRAPVNGISMGGPDDYYERYGLPREVVNPVQRSWAAEPDRVPRAVVHGWPANFIPPSDADSPQGLIRVLGPGPDPRSNVFRKELDFLEPFNPAGAIHRGGYGLRDLAVALRSFHAAPSQLFAPSGPMIEHIAPVVPRDPAGATGLVFTIQADSGQVFGSFHGGSSPRLKIAGARAAQRETTDLRLVSAVELGGGEIAILMVGSNGAAEVLKLGAAGVSLLRRMPAAGYASRPPNADALASNAQGALAILRTPSGAEPPSAADPALVMPLGGGPIIALAPWSTLTTADDPACRKDPSGYRAIVQPVASWLQVRGSTRARSTLRSYSIPAGVRPRSRDSSAAPLLARVRWGVARVCLEAVEVADGSRTVRQDDLGRGGEELETAVLARFTGSSPVAGHLGVMLGAELHQALTCKLGPN
jgi:hypothetical protein